MTQRTNLFAYTESSVPVGEYVGYLSLNRETDGRITLCVRERGDSTKQATITLPPEVLEDFAVDVLAQITGEPRVSVTQVMVNRFLQWPVPAHVHPDGAPGQPGRTGTNLLDAPTAQEMLQHVLGG